MMTDGYVLWMIFYCLISTVFFIIFSFIFFFPEPEIGAEKEEQLLMFFKISFLNEMLIVLPFLLNMLYNSWSTTK